VAVGADMSLSRLPASPLRGLTQAKPASPQQPAVPQFGARPPMISDSRVQDVVNNQLASSAGARELATRSMDRAGVSRGKGQAYYGDIAQAGGDVQARNAAAETEMGAASANASAQAAYDSAMRNEQLTNAGLLESMRNAEARERMAKMGWQQDLYEATRRGQFGLDQYQLDFTPLLSGLLR